MFTRLYHVVSPLRGISGKSHLKLARNPVQIKGNFCVIRAASCTAKFKVLNGSIDRSSPEFLSGKSQESEVNAKFLETMNSALSGGGEKAIERHTKRNKKLLVRDRLSKLLDQGTDFLEFSPFAGLDLEYGDVPCAGVVTGVGQVSGQLCVVIANDATVKGGTIYPITVNKQLRAQEIAEVNSLPCIYLVDSGGAFLPLQAEIFPETGGQVFFNEAVMSMKKIPTVCVVCGSCTAGAAYVPTMADEAVILDKIGTIFLGGPPLVKAATGEVVTAEELGGALMHSSVSGCTDHFATSEEDALEMTRNIIATLNREQQPTPSDVEEPQFEPEDLLTLSLYNSSQFPIYQILARIVDGSRFQEFKTKYGSTLVTGFAQIHGYLVGIVANNGALTSGATLKGAHFVELCCQRDIPLIFLHNTLPQFSEGLSASEQACLLKDQAKMMAAVACAHVPKISVIMKESFGPNNQAMCGRSFDPHFLYTWPTAQVAMDTAEALATECCAEAEEADEEQRRKLHDRLTRKFYKESTAYYGSARLWDDGLILPQDTRKVLGLSLRAALSSYSRGETGYKFGVFRM